MFVYPGSGGRTWSARTRRGACFPHVVKVVVLPAGADALLGVASARDSSSRRSDRGLVLVHPRVGEEEGRVVVPEARRGAPAAS